MFFNNLRSCDIIANTIARRILSKPEGLNTNKINTAVGYASKHPAQIRLLNKTITSSSKQG